MDEFKTAMKFIGMVTEVGSAIVGAVLSGDESILDKPVREVLGGKLAITLAKEAADARAEAKFGAGT